MMVFSLAVFAKASFAQDDDDDDDDMSSDGEEMDEDTWQAQMDEYTAKQTDLTSQLNALETEITGLKGTLQSTTDRAENARNTLWSGVGSMSEFETYKTKLSEAEKKAAACKGPDDAAAIEKDMMPYLTDAGINGRMKCVPVDNVFDRYNALKKKIADCKLLAPKMEGYTVVKGDCLSKIAGMKNIYGNSRLWPAIWEANKSGVVSAPPKVAKTIPNPNLIYPGQVLKIPALTDAQKTEMSNKSTNYRKKRVMKKESSDSSNEKKTPPPTMKKDTTKKK
ncbi:MAG TPA: LysM peptidoglycan-binding domain-containing protein [Ignavibacteria bacterium]|nr:LysM peptidoglycan-binding domain-containing protein [Ignavibacteria bacterium]